MKRRILAAVAALCLGLPGCTQESAVVRDFAKALKDACPSAGLDDEVARNACAEALALHPALMEGMNETLLWGGHKVGSDFDPLTKHLTRFSSYIYRRVYLSGFTFDGSYEVEKSGDFEVLKMNARFRNQLPPGAYAYPFWHDQGKWDAYQFATHVYFVFEAGRVVAVYRVGKDESLIARDPGTFDGAWRWVDAAGEEQPAVTLFKNSLSSDNPHAEALDTAFRALESAFREEGCEACHVPNNPAMMPQLVLLNYPAQALGDRQKLLEVFEDNSMPPGLPLDDEVLGELKALTEEFVRLGDLALSFEASK